MAMSTIMHVDQENAHVVKGGNNHTRARFGPSKSFQSNNAPLPTPRRALGDLGNLNFESKSKSVVKPFGDPLQHIRGSVAVSTRKSQKKKTTLKAVANVKKKIEPQFPEKEKMFPFTEAEEKPPQSHYVNTILKNVDKLYHGCFRRYSEPAASEETLDQKLDFVLELERRPFSDADILFPTFEETESFLEDDGILPPLLDLDFNM